MGRSSNGFLVVFYVFFYFVRNRWNSLIFLTGHEVFWDKFWFSVFFSVYRRTEVHGKRFWMSGAFNRTFGLDHLLSWPCLPSTHTDKAETWETRRSRWTFPNSIRKNGSNIRYEREFYFFLALLLFDCHLVCLFFFLYFFPLVLQNWKARISAYEELAKTFAQAEPDDAEFKKFAGKVKDFVQDAHAASQEKGLDAAMAFVDNANPVLAGKWVAFFIDRLSLLCV